MAIIDKIQTLASGVILFLDADDNTILQGNSVDFSYKLSADQASIYLQKDGSLMQGGSLNDVTRLQAYPAAESAFVSTAAALAALLDASFFGSPTSSSVNNLLKGNTATVATVTHAGGASSGSATLIAKNSARKGLIVSNFLNVEVFLEFGANVANTTTQYGKKLTVGEVYPVPEQFAACEIRFSFAEASATGTLRTSAATYA